MGIGGFGSSSHYRSWGSSSFNEPVTVGPANISPVSSNPDPKNWKMIRCEQFNNVHVVMLHYPDCKNHDGKKILVKKGMWKDPEELDPHFDERDTNRDETPIARFEPTDQGWAWACDFAKNVEWVWI